MKNVHVTVYVLWFLFLVSIDGLLLLHFCKWRAAVSRICFMVFCIISINGLLLLHFCKWRNGHVAVYSSLFFSSSPLTDCYFYTSAHGERAYNRVWLMVSFPSLHWRIATSTLLHMENGHITVYDLWFLFLVSIDGLLLLHFCTWRTGR